MPEPLAQVVSIAQPDSQGFEAVAADEPAEPAADQAEDQALARPVGQPLAQADAQAEHRPEQARPSSPPWKRPITTSPSTSPSAPPSAAAGTPQVTARASLSQAPSRNGPQAFRKKPIVPPMIRPARASRNVDRLGLDQSRRRDTSPKSAPRPPARARS